MRKHTPGPWHTDVNDTHVSVESENMPKYPDCFPKTSSEGPIYVCSFKSSNSTSDRDYCPDGAKLLLETNEANACLIAAAPEILDALKQITEAFGRYLYGSETKMYEITQARAAIAKAEGVK